MLVINLFKNDVCHSIGIFSHLFSSLYQFEQYSFLCPPFFIFNNLYLFKDLVISFFGHPTTVFCLAYCFPLCIMTLDFYCDWLTQISTFADMEGEETFEPSFLGSADEVVEERIADDAVVMIKGTKNTSAVSDWDWIVLCISVVFFSLSFLLEDEIN